MKIFWLEQGIKYYNRASFSLPDPDKPGVALAAPKSATLDSTSNIDSIPGSLPQSAIEVLYQYGCDHQRSGAIARLSPTEPADQASLSDDESHQVESRTGAIVAPRFSYRDPDHAAQLDEPAARGRASDNERHYGFLPDSAIAKRFAARSSYDGFRSIIPSEHIGPAAWGGTINGYLHDDLTEILAVLLEHDYGFDRPNPIAQLAFPESFNTPNYPVVLKSANNGFVQGDLAESRIDGSSLSCSRYIFSKPTCRLDAYEPVFRGDMTNNGTVERYRELAAPASVSGSIGSPGHPSGSTPSESMTLVIEHLLDHFEDPFVSLDGDQDSRSEFMTKILSCLPLHLRNTRVYHQHLQRRRKRIIIDRDLLPNPVHVTDELSGLGPPGDEVAWKLVDFPSDYHYEPFMFSGYNGPNEEGLVQDESSVDGHFRHGSPLRNICDPYNNGSVDNQNRDKDRGDRMPAFEDGPGLAVSNNDDRFTHEASPGQVRGAQRNNFEDSTEPTEYGLNVHLIFQVSPGGGNGNSFEDSTNLDGNGDLDEYLGERNPVQDALVLGDLRNDDHYIYQFHPNQGHGTNDPFVSNHFPGGYDISGLTRGTGRDFVIFEDSPIASESDSVSRPHLDLGCRTERNPFADDHVSSEEDITDLPDGAERGPFDDSTITSAYDILDFPAQQASNFSQVTTFGSEEIVDAIVDDVVTFAEYCENGSLGESAYGVDDENSNSVPIKSSKYPRRAVQISFGGLYICEICGLVVCHCPYEIGPDETPDPIRQFLSHHPRVCVPLNKIHVCRNYGPLDYRCLYGKHPSSGTHLLGFLDSGRNGPSERTVEDAIQHLRTIRSPTSMTTCLECFLRGYPYDHPEDHCPYRTATNHGYPFYGMHDFQCSQEAELTQDYDFTPTPKSYVSTIQSSTHSENNSVLNADDIETSNKTVVSSTPPENVTPCVNAKEITVSNESIISSAPAESDSVSSAIDIERLNMGIYSLHGHIESNISNLDKMINNVKIIQEAHRAHQHAHSSPRPGEEEDQESEMDIDESGNIYLKETKAQRIKRLRADNWSKVLVPWKGPEYYQKLCDIIIQEMDERH
ncbi:hypothetical protein N7495_003993 [Penicillium taxi]|uniref:uncharacterized protein n=1 Tax=Penicillium taxi TaxID=168475 RepID=UPI002545377A|nr:uncharacterized protein N7495_003993 [Penicillium taxi]KAJ5899249.1 hypothetical protein N7495_003993 [Penicillium taxi]